MYNGGNGTTKPGPLMPNGYRRNQEDAIAQHAKALGWTGPMTRSSDLDLCPICTVARTSEDGGLEVVTKTLPAKIYRWFKGQKHWLVDDVFGGSFVRVGPVYGKYKVQFIDSGNYIVVQDGVTSIMTAEEVAKRFQLPC